MRTILLTASEYAKMFDFIFVFDVEHVQKALERVVIRDPKKRELIYQVFDYEHDAPKEVDIKIDSNNDAECTEEVLLRLSLLRDMGLDIFSDDDFIPYTGELPFGYKSLDEYGKSIPSSLSTESSAEKVSKKDFKKIIEAPQGFERLHAIKALKSVLNETVLNQEHAVEAVCDALVKSEHIQDKERPKGIFFFLGPPATGKTFLAKTLRTNLRGYDRGMVFDMTQFSHEESGGALYGTSRMWGNTKPGSLTSYVRKHPKSIIVFDEFEKANTAVQGNLLSILSGGYLEDACGWCGDGKQWTSERKDDDEAECDEKNIESRVDFSQTIVIFTSNLGKEVYNNASLMHTLKDDPIQVEKMIFDAIAREEKQQKSDMVPAITPEMLSRLKQGSMVLFNKLDYKELRMIAEDTLEKERLAFEKNYKIKIKYEPEALDALLLSFSPSFDIRALKASIGKKVFDAITDNYMHTGVIFKRVDVSLDKEAKKALAELTLDPPSMLKDLKRKNRSINFDSTISNTKTIMKITFSDLHINTIKKAKDFGDDGITIEVPDISFSDISGHDFVKEKLSEVVGLLKDFKTLQALQTKLSKGMLLYGPPGTGKTMLAKALATEADLPFISTTGQELLADGKIAKVFSSAREYAPSIVFIDEIDAIPTRGVNTYTDTVVNQLLTQMDGFNTSVEEPVFVIAATNRLDKIDPAILRSGRIDIHVEVAALDKKARAYFIDKMLEKPMFSDKINTEEIVKFTANLNGSDLEKVERESILFMYRNGLKEVTHEILLEQVNTIKYGRKLEDKNLQSALDATAYHEAGHAIVAKILLPFKRIEQVTVMPRNKSLGFVSFSESDEYYSHSVEYIKNEICVSLAGRIAQTKQFGTQGMDSGASSDLENANRLAYAAIARYGMDEELKNLSVAVLDEEEQAFKNDVIFARMQSWLGEMTQKTEELVSKHWKSIDRLAKRLIEDEQIDEVTLDKIMKTTQATT